MSIQSQLRRGRGGSFRGNTGGKSFLGKTLTRVTVTLPSSSGVWVGVNNANREEVLAADGPVTYILRAVGSCATVVLYDQIPSPSGSGSQIGNVDWVMYVEGEFDDTGTVNDSNTASLATRIESAIESIGRLSVRSLDSNGEDENNDTLITFDLRNATVTTTEPYTAE